MKKAFVVLLMIAPLFYSGLGVLVYNECSATLRAAIITHNMQR